MARHGHHHVLPRRLRAKPVQTAKFVGILLALGLGFAGFFRLIDASAVIAHPLLADGQFLALVLLPLVSLLLVCVVSIEAAVSLVRYARSSRSLTVPDRGGTGYLLLRATEASIAILGVAVMASVVPTLLADATPAPVGVGAMLLLMAVGIGILVTSFLRAFVELVVYPGTG